MKNKLYIMLLTVMIFTAIGGVVGCSSKDSQISDMASSLGESSDSGVGSTEIEESNFRGASGDEVNGDTGTAKKSNGFSKILEKLMAITNYSAASTSSKDNKDGVSDTDKTSMEYTDNDVLGGDSITKKNPEDSIGLSEAAIDSHSSSDLSNYKNDYVEFISYPDQQISDGMGMVLTNLSANKGVKMVFTISENGKVLKKSEAIDAGKDWTVNAKDLGLKEGKYDITILSEAYTENGTTLNCVEQTIVLTVGEQVAGTQTKYFEDDNQPNGTSYETAVYYEADNTEFSTIVPAVVGIEKDDIGADIYVSFRALNAKKGMTATVKATNVDNKTTIALAGGSEKATAVLSSEKDGDASLNYTFNKVYSGLQQVGPIHCNVEKGKAAKQSYYGTCKFTVGLTTSSSK